MPLLNRLARGLMNRSPLLSKSPVMNRMPGMNRGPSGPSGPPQGLGPSAPIIQNAVSQLPNNPPMNPPIEPPMSPMPPPMGPPPDAMNQGAGGGIPMSKPMPVQGGMNSAGMGPNPAVLQQMMQKKRMADQNAMMSSKNRMMSGQ